MTLLLAGHETTARALTWTWHLLTRIRTRRRGCGPSWPTCSATGPPTAADYAGLPYTQAVFRETLRLYPPVWALARIATRDVDAGPAGRPGRRHRDHEPVGGAAKRRSTSRTRLRFGPSAGWQSRSRIPVPTSRSAAAPASASASGSRCSRGCWCWPRSPGAGR